MDTEPVNDAAGSKRCYSQHFVVIVVLCLCSQAAGALPRPHSLLHVQHGESLALSLQESVKVTLLFTLSVGCSICL